MKNEHQTRTPSGESRSDGAAPSPERTAQLQSWIDNVIVPIFVQEILKVRRKVGENLGVIPDQS